MSDAGGRTQPEPELLVAARAGDSSAFSGHRRELCAPLGGGTPAFAQPPTAPLHLLDTRTRGDSSNMLVRYAVAGKTA